MHDRDYEVIRRVWAGKKRAFAELIDRHKEKRMTFAMRMLKNRQDTEETLQDAFLRVCKAMLRNAVAKRLGATRPVTVYQGTKE